MFAISRQFKRVVRAVVLMALFAASVFNGQMVTAQPTAVQPNQPQRVSQDVLDRLGIQRPQATNLTELSLQIAQQVQTQGLPASAFKLQRPEVGGLPDNLNGQAALSAAIMTILNSHPSSNFKDVMLMADADGREDLVADHAAKVSDWSGLPSGWILTRAAVSAHTFATGYTNTVYYYGDSMGNVFVGVDTTGDAQTDNYTVLNLPTILNAFGSLNSDDQIVITGLAVNPVADLSSFARVNGAFAPFDGKIGEMLYVTFWDTGSGLRLTGNGQVVQSGVLAFPIADDVSPASAPPGILSQAGFPMTVGGSFGVVFSVFANVAGVAVDDDGSIYFQQVDLIGLTGGNITKITSFDQPGPGGNQDRSLATSGIGTLTTLFPVNGNYSSTSGPPNQINRVTNYSGSSPTFGNIAALAAGPNNIVYAAVARSFVPTDPIEIQNTAGLFANPATLGATPSMIISFADTSGAFDLCTGVLSSTFQVTGTLPVADGFADVAQAGLPPQPGVNNFRAFVLGNGPDVRGTLIGAMPANTLQMDFQVDDTIYSGLAADEESKVYVISGGTPAGVGRNPSPTRSEILVFPDQQLFDRRADFVDLRDDVAPNPPAFINNVGNGQSNRYDHLYYQAPLDQVSLTPAGLSGLARGFLVYLNRTRGDTTLFPDLPNSIPQGDDATSGPLFFDSFDPGRQIAGGDDQNPPFRGDDDDGGGNPITTTVLTGGFEFTYREYITSTGNLSPTAWNAFYLNSNGSLTFGAGDTSNVPDAADFLSTLPRVAGAWADLNPSSRQGGFTNTFPIQALGFANINHFVVRWINVPAFGYESCNSSNTFSTSLYDDGTGLDENASQPLNPANPIGNNAVPFDLQEGPTNLRFVTDPNNALVGINPRPDRSGNLCFTYGRMDLLGSQAAGDATLVGVTPGRQPITTTPGINLSAAAVSGDAPFPAPLGVAMGSTIPASPYELFTLGVPASYTITGGITTTFPARPVYDLRQEGNDPVLSTAATQPDPNRGQVCFYNLTPQTITFDPLPNKQVSDPPFTVVATATSGLTVTFTASGQCSPSGVTGATITLLGVGSCTVTAHQPGNATYAAALSVSRTFLIVSGYVVYLPTILK